MLKNWQRERASISRPGVVRVFTAVCSRFQSPCRARVFQEPRVCAVHRLPSGGHGVGKPPSGLRSQHLRNVAAHEIENTP